MDEVDNDQLESLLSQGIFLVDVRTPEEFAQAHIAQARNIPVLFRAAGGADWAPNPDFLRVVTRHFPPEARLALSCASGIRSRHAAALLARAGYTQIAHLTAGLLGGRDPFGAKLTGWQETGRPVTDRPAPGATYAELLDESAVGPDEAKAMA